MPIRVSILEFTEHKVISNVLTRFLWEKNRGRKRKIITFFFYLSLLKDKQYTLLDYFVWICTYLCIGMFCVHTCLCICTYICKGMCTYVCLRTTSGFWMKTKTLPINPTCLPDYISLENIPGTAFSERERERKKKPTASKNTWFWAVGCPDCFLLTTSQ